ncbi:formate dehydrogenase subunit delta [Paucibacter sediminis]|uniref:Formate dehydrogenase subunit delta n=1 Tax=Paucibacter sediminis TaxID=3019553 RepID=A0AA95NMX2_9BURK|nr:formate dehydrogenase subunit delta [Paucibacter sp. S2-9]WIT12851.1 formate dehydrogenase subunit delta [Paucibacter sp. S2-9]
MHIDTLVRMANQIGAFFEAMPDHQEAVEGIAQHLKKFWEPRMRRELLAQLDGGHNPGLHAMVLEAIQRHRSLLA